MKQGCQLSIEEIVKAEMYHVLIALAAKKGLLCTVLPVIGGPRIMESGFYLGKYTVDVSEAGGLPSSVDAAVTLYGTLHLIQVEWAGPTFFFYVTNPTVFDRV